MNGIDRHVAGKIRARRVALGLSMQEVAAVVGLSYQQIQKFEIGINRVHASHLHSLAKALDCEPGDFFPGGELDCEQSSIELLRDAASMSGEHLNIVLNLSRELALL